MQSLVKRELVRMIQRPACRQTLGQSADGDARRTQKVSDIASRSLAFDIGAKSKNDLFCFEGFHAFNKGLKTQILGRDVVERRQFTAENMVKTIKCTAALKAKDISGLLYHTNEARVPLRVVAKQAGTALLDEKAAIRARINLAGKTGKRLRQRWHAITACLHHPQHEPLRTARTNAGQRLQLRDEALESRRIIDGHERDYVKPQAVSSRPCFGMASAGFFLSLR